jgi:hypothetical protein
MKERDITAGFMLDKQDYNALRNYYMYKRTPKRTKLMVCLLAASLLLLAMSESVFAFPFFKLLGLCGILAIAAIYSCISIDARRLEKGAQQLIGVKQETTFTEEGFTVIWKELGKGEEYLWTETEYVYEDDDYFFICVGSYSFIIISKLYMKLYKKEYQIKQIHDLIERHAKLIAELRNYQYEKF